jgi:hypothetical protein
MSNVFEQELGASLRTVPGVWVHKFADGMYARRPGDFVVIHRGHGAVIEAKMVREPTFAFSGWSREQRAQAAEISASRLPAEWVERRARPETYWLVVNWRNRRYGPRGAVGAFPGSTLCDLSSSGFRGSLGPESAVSAHLRLPPLPPGCWDVGPLLEAISGSKRLEALSG